MDFDTNYMKNRLKSKVQAKQFSLKKLINPKNIALTMLGINLSNIISPTFYVILLVTDAIFVFYYVCLVLLMQTTQVPIKNLWVFETYLDSLSSQDCLTIQIPILVLNLVLLLLIVILALKQKDYTTIKQSNFIKKIVSLLLTLKQTIFFIPLLSIFLRTVSVDYNDKVASIHIATQFINGINVLFFIFYQIVLRRIGNIKIRVSWFPQSEVNQSATFLFFLLKVCFVVIEVLFAEKQDLKTYINYLCFVLLFLNIATCIYRIIVAPIHNKLINTTVNIINFALLGCSFCIIMIMFEQSQNQSNMYYLAIMIPAMIILYVLLDAFWEQKIFNQIRILDFKMALHIEYMLQKLQVNLVNLLSNNAKISSASLNNLFSIIQSHNQQCINEYCSCHKIETIIWIVNQRQSESQKIIELTSEDVDQLNKFTVEDFIKSECSNTPFCYNNYMKSTALHLVTQQNQQMIENEIGNNYKNIKNDKYSHMMQTDLYNSTFHNEIDISVDDETNKVVNKIYQIDLDKLYQSFFANFIKLYFEFAIKKFPDNANLKIQYAFFALFHMRNIFQCINILKGLHHQKQNKFSSISSKVNEFYLCFEIQRLIEEQEQYECGYKYDQMGVINQELTDNIYYTQQKIDPEKYVEYSNLQQAFQQTIQQLSYCIFSFWKLVQNVNLTIAELLKLSMTLATEIAEAHDLFKRIEEFNQNKDETLYFQFAQLHKELLNDKLSYELYIQKYRHTMNMKKISKNDNYSSQIQDQGVILVNSQFQKFGQILECNIQLKKMSGYTTEDMHYQNYEIFMNQLIKQWHPHFVSNFHREGQSQKINKKRINQFMKSKKGYIIPIQLQIKYLFSHTYGYCFIGIISPVKEVKIDRQLMPSNKVIFILCDNQEGRIFDACKNAAKHLKLKKQYFDVKQTMLDNDLIITDIAPQIDIKKINELIRMKDLTKHQQIEGICAVDLQAITQKMKHITKPEYVRKNLVIAKFSMIKEQYLHPEFEMNIIMLHLNISGDNSSQNNIRIGNQKQLADSQEHKLEEEEKFEFEISSMSSASSTSQNMNDMIKNQKISMKKKIPKSLRIVLQMLSLMFFSMIAVAIINLYLSQSRKDMLVNQVLAVKTTFDKIYYATRARISLRLLISYANGYEPKSTIAIPDKLKFIHEQLAVSQIGLLNAQQYIENGNFEISDSSSAYFKSSYIPVEYLDDKCNSYTQNHTMSYLINTMVAKILEIQNMKTNQVLGRLDIQTLKPASFPYKPTEDEMSIFFTNQNGNNAMRYYNWEQADIYVDELKDFAQRSIQFMLVTMIVSLVVIIIVFLIITPIVSIILDRQFVCLKFFFYLNKEQVDQLIQQSKKFLDEIQLENDQISGNYDQEKKKVNQSQLDMQELNFISKNNIHDVTQQSNNTLLNSNHYTYNNNSMTIHDTYNNIHQTNMDYSESPSIISAGENNQRIKKVSQGNVTVFKQEEYKEGMINMTEIKLEEQQQPQSQQLYLNQQSEKSIKVSQENVVNQQQIIEKLEFSKHQRRYKVIALNVFFLIFFSIFFIASFFIAQKLFSQVSYIIDNLKVIYYKDVCIENLMIYTKANQMRNDTVLFPETGEVASTALVQQCLEFENLYREIRKTNHPAFEMAFNFMEQVESDQLCNITYENDITNRDICYSTFNGILQKGLSDSISLMIAHFNKEDIKFNANLNRSMADLIKYNTDLTTSQLIETKIYFLDSVFAKMKYQITHSSDTYFSNQTHQFIILFGFFLSIVVILMILIFGFWLSKIKDFMWKVNLTLKILPIELLNQDEVSDLKKFLDQ